MTTQKRAPDLFSCLHRGNCCMCMQTTCCPCWVYAKNWVHMDDPKLLTTEYPNCHDVPGVGCYCDNVPCKKALLPCLLYSMVMIIEGFASIPYTFQPILICIQQRGVFKDVDTKCRCGPNTVKGEDCSCLESFVCGPCKLSQEALYYKEKAKTDKEEANKFRSGEIVATAPYMRMHMPM